MTDPSRQLRDALTARAAQVPVSPDALDTIRTRIRRGARRRYGLVAGLGALATAATAGVAALALTVGTGAPLSPPSTAAGPSTTARPASPTASPTPSTTASEASLPVYYSGAKDRFYREFRALRSDGSATGQIAAALTAMIDLPARDPDYRTLWPAGARVNGVTTAGPVITVDLSVPSAVPANPAAAVQQLVYSATAAAFVADHDELDQVRVLVDGQPVATLWGVDIHAPLRRAPAAQVQALVWLVDPAEGATVGRDVRVQIQGSVFEAAATLRVRRPDGATVLERPVQLDNGAPAVGTATVTVTLTPGTYTVEAFFHSAQDGSEQAIDDHTVTVR